MRYPRPIQNLIEQLSRFPAVGPKTAERYVSYLIKQPEEVLDQLADSIKTFKKSLIVCQNCLNITEKTPCAICSDPNRRKNVVCVVSDSRGAAAIEKTGEYAGVYYILGGEINEIDGVGPDQLNTKKLLWKMKQGEIEELILALNPTFEGETTSMYLAKEAANSGKKIKVTKLAKGLPMGADLEYADEITLTHAIKYRVNI